MTNEEKRIELEREIAFQKERMLTAGRQGVNAIRNDLSPMNWLNDYPMQSALAIAAGGYLLARALGNRRRVAPTTPSRSKPDYFQELG
jgi:hypothetical protein